MAKCQGQTAKGQPCKRNARKNHTLCWLHGKDEKSSTPEAKSCARDRGVDDEFSPHFKELLALCRAEILTPSENTQHVQQWGRLQLDVVRHALEHQRILDGHGVGVQYICNKHYPAGDRPLPPPDEEAPPTGATGDDERVLN